jgi:hypothetical protein
VFLCQACKSAIIASKMALSEEEERIYWIFAWGLLLLQLIIIIVYECIQKAKRNEKRRDNVIFRATNGNTVSSIDKERQK